VVVAAVAGEVAVAVVAVAAVVVVRLAVYLLYNIANEYAGWTGGNNDPVRNSRW
jgi:hypothetical protein